MKSVAASVRYGPRPLPSGSAAAGGPSLRRLVFSETRLFGAYLAGAYLAGAYLAGAHLTGAHLAEGRFPGGASLRRRPLQRMGGHEHRQVD
ncbi:MAG: pentapeptide repeat-containing protein [Desulfovibrio sp.]|nr:pentapeptide repeat-containing protein [Desulfovibrio sp.]